MASELSEFEENMRREIDAFLKPEKGSDKTARSGESRRAMRPAADTPTSAPQSAKAMKTGHLVKLAVRQRQLELDTVFEHHSTSISKLEAQLEAEKAAKKAGYPIIGHVIDIQRL